MFRTDRFDLRPLADPAAVVRGENYRITVLTDRLMRLEWAEDGRFDDRPTQRVFCRRFPAPAFTVRETEEGLEIETDGLHLWYDKQKFSPEGLSIEVKGLRGHKCDRWNYGMARIRSYQKSSATPGAVRTLDGVDGEIPLEPGIPDRYGFSVLDDTSTLRLDDEGWFVPAEQKDAVDQYFFGYASDYAGCVRDFVRLSGHAPQIPRYALGNWWSRYHKYTEESYLDLLDRFAERGIPLSVAVIDMDWHNTELPEGNGDGWTGYTWNRDFFPDPERFLAELHERGLKTTLNIHPHNGIQPCEECYEAAAGALGKDPAEGKAIRFDASDPAFMKVYLEQVLRPLEEQGVDFWWPDWQQVGGAKTGYDPLWMLNHYLTVAQWEKPEYGLTMSRYGGIGSHRYPLGFSGDTVMSWASLDFQPYFTACAANLDYGWWSHDIGGHWQGVFEDELEVRWFQYGVFSPIFRPHSSKNSFLIKEPWNFPAETERLLSKAMRERQKLVPYLYTMAVRDHEEGIPLVRPLYHVWPKMVTRTEIPYRNEYLFGSELVVCPITEKADPATGTGRVTAWIPPGDWFDLYTHRHYRGEKQEDLYRQADSIPVLAKAGGIVPLSDDPPVNGTPLPQALRLKVFCGADGAFTLFEDNSLAVGTKKAVTAYRLRWGAEAIFEADAPQGDREILPEGRTVTVELIGLTKPEKMVLRSAGKETDQTFIYDETGHAASVVIPAEACVQGFALRVSGDGRLAENDWKAEFERRLARFQIPLAEKTKIWEEALRADSRLSMAGRLPSLCTNAHELGELLEILSAGE